MDMVEIATPEVPQAEPWSSLERLNKERDLVGIYLSAHPLDDYAVILQNVCNVHMADLKDLEQFVNMDLTLGGMVTAVRKGISKTGKPYGIVTMRISREHTSWLCSDRIGLHGAHIWMWGIRSILRLNASPGNGILPNWISVSGALIFWQM